MDKKGFQHIVLVGRSNIFGVPQTLTVLKDFLISLNIQLTIEAATAQLMDSQPLAIASSDKLPIETDLIIVVGGDGSLLNAAHIAMNYNIPVLGINRGRLGFLTDISPDEMYKIKDVVEGNYKEEQRFLLKVDLYHQHEKCHSDVALNDLVLSLGDMPQMIEFSTYVNEQFVCNQRADGLIVASPTGSTAYALSGGGPIIHPDLCAVTLVPMLPHTLSSRPIVVNANAKIKIMVSTNNENPPYISCDGQNRTAVPPGASIEIVRKKQTLKLIHPASYDYFTTLRDKLGWEQHAMRNIPSSTIE